MSTTHTECANGCGYVPVGRKPAGWRCGTCDPARRTEHGATTDQTFDGLAFPVATVRYSNGHFNATIKRDDDTFRARVSYSHAIGPGARNAVRAARAAFDKLQADRGTFANEDYVAIPGDMDRDRYTFTFVPKHFFDRS